MRAMISALVLFVVVLSVGCSPSAYSGIPLSAIPDPARIAEATQSDAAGGVAALETIAAGNAATVTQSQAAALLIVLEASAEDREALRILRRRAAEID